MTIDLQVLNAEVSMLGTNYKNELDHAIRMLTTALEAYNRSGRIDPHLGHNLANRATELAAIAGRVDEVGRFRLYLDLPDPSKPDAGDFGDTDR